MKRRKLKSAIALAFYLMLQVVPVFASADSIFDQKFTVFQDLVSSFVSAVGIIITLWGFFEWGNSMQSGDGSAQSMAFRRIGGGLVMLLAPQILSILL